MKKLTLGIVVVCWSSLGLASTHFLPTPPAVWRGYDAKAGDFKEEVISEQVQGGILYRDTYISAYVNGEEIRVFTKYAVKEGARKAPGLLNIHGWMSQASIDSRYVRDGWAVISHDYCGKTGDRPHYTKYPESLVYCNMDKSLSGGAINSKLKDGSSITQPSQTSDYVWYAIQRRVLEYFLSQKEVDAKRIGAKGYSYGGTIIWNLGMDPRVKAIVAYFGVGYLEYYRTRSVWMYSQPPVAPPKTPGEKLYLSALAPQAHAPYISAASLWLNGSNDHHGGHERGEQIFKRFRPHVPWDFAIQARGHHNTEKLGDNEWLWMKKHVLGKKVFWPARPRSEIRLDRNGVPQLRISPASPQRITELKAYYALKDPVSFGRAWRDAETKLEGNTWVAQMPVLNVDDYVFGFSNIRYNNDCVLASDFEAAIPSKLGKAVATDTVSNEMTGGASQWSDAAPAEGLGGIMGFRPLNRHHGTHTKQVSDPKFKAPNGSNLSFKFYCTQPQSLKLVVNDHFETDLEITASNEWQAREIPAKAMVQRDHGHSLGDWSEAKTMQLKPKDGSDITMVIFADFKWVDNRPKLKPDAEGRYYLDIKAASEVDSFWRVNQDKAVEGTPIRIEGTEYAHGLGVHAPSSITFNLNGDYRSFHVIPGPDDAHHGELEMSIFIDGEQVWSSGVVRSPNFRARPKFVPVFGAKSLTLKVGDGGNGKGGDHASWAEAYLTK